MRMMYYSVSETGILGKRKFTSSDALRPSDYLVGMLSDFPIASSDALSKMSYDETGNRISFFRVCPSPSLNNAFSRMK